MQRKQWGVILRAKEYWIQPETEKAFLSLGFPQIQLLLSLTVDSLRV